VAGRYRLVVDALNGDRVEEIYQLLRIDFGDADVELDPNGLVYCYVKTPKAVKRRRDDVMRLLNRHQLADEIVTPISAERFVEHDGSYGGMTRADKRDLSAEHRRIRRALTDVRWIVTVVPAGVFHWAELKRELERRGRKVLEERQGTLERWWRREQVFGNYAEGGSSGTYGF